MRSSARSGNATPQAALLSTEAAQRHIEQLDAVERIRRYFSGGMRPGRLRFGQASPKHFKFQKDRRKRRILKGGNQSAKTVAGTVESVLICAHKHPFRAPIPEPVAARCVCPDLPLSMDDPHIQRDTVKQWCPPDWLRGGSWETAYAPSAHVLYFADGGYLEFLSFNQSVEAHAGEHRHFVWFDEEPPQSIYDENVARLARGRELGEWFMTYVPIAGLQWIYEQLYEPALKGERPDIGLHEVTIWDNAHNLAPGFIKQFESNLPEDKRAVRLAGQYGVREGLVFGIFSADHVVENEFEVVRE